MNKPVDLAISPVTTYAASHSTGKKLYWTLSDIDDPDYMKAILRLLTVQISSEYNSYQLQQVQPVTPHELIELGYTMRDEATHGIGLCRILRDLGVDPEPIRLEAMFGDNRGKVLGIFKIPLDTPYHVGAIRWLGERVGGYQSIAVHGCSYVPYAIWSAKNYLDEGRTHSMHGRDVLTTAIEQGHKAIVQQVADLYYPHALDMFGGNGTPNELEYLKYGIKTWSNNELRRIWIETVMEDYEQMGLTKPADIWQGDRAHYGE